MNPWIENDGVNRSPVEIGTLVDVIFRDGQRLGGVTARRSSFDALFSVVERAVDNDGTVNRSRIAMSWNLCQGGSDIVKWRLYKPTMTRKDARRYCRENPGYQVVDNGKDAEKRWTVEIKEI